MNRLNTNTYSSSFILRINTTTWTLHEVGASASALRHRLDVLTMFEGERVLCAVIKLEKLNHQFAVRFTMLCTKGNREIFRPLFLL